METEKAFLASYRAEDYDRPSVATDIVSFLIQSEEGENYRKLPELHLNVLLIERAGHPFKGMWALPGGFAKSNETLEETARRELEEETGVRDVYMEQLYTFSEPGRDPRTRVISSSYMALLHEKLPLKADTDAHAAAWFKLSYKLIKETKEVEGEKYTTRQYYELTLTQGEKVLKAEIISICHREKARLDREYSIGRCEGIAFDHAKIIAVAIERLRGKIEYSDVAFYLVPEYFTLTGLQKVYEIVLDKVLTPANFRRKIMEQVEETDEVDEGGGYRNAKLYRRR